jgi:Transforming acidic coiled-coil-containing protein (TACC), C-terminal
MRPSFVFSANEEIAKVKRSTESEMVVLQAALRKAEMQAQSLEQTVEQKVGFYFTVGHEAYAYW